MNAAPPENAYAMALSHTLLSARTLRRLHQAMGSAEAAWRASDASLQALIPKPESLQKYLTARNRIDPEQLAAEAAQRGTTFITSTHAAYPELLAQSHDPPYGVYCQGNLHVLSGSTMLAVVGTRHCSDYGRRVTRLLISDLAPFNPTIVSGLALGIDTAAHRAALDFGLPTVAVFGTPVTSVYPKSNIRLAQEIVAAGGLVLSEYPLTPGDKFAFPRRNRIIAGLTHGTLVVEGDVKSGALITAKYALEDNRQVMAVPGNIGQAVSEGPNRLIQQGAAAILSATDIADSLGWLSTTPAVSPAKQTTLSFDPPAAAPSVSTAAVQDLPPDLREVWETLGAEPVSLDTLHSRSPALSIAMLQRALTHLELEGLVTTHPGAKFCRI